MLNHNSVSQFCCVFSVNDLGSFFGLGEVAKTSPTWQSLRFFSRIISGCVPL